MKKSVEQSIVKTLSYFDIFSAPLTADELYTYLWNPEETVSYSHFFEQLHSLNLSSVIESQGGYFFIRGRSKIIAQRERRIWYMEKKIKQAQKAARLLRFIPFVQSMFVCNQIQIGVTEKSDIDVLVVARSGRLYLARFFVTAILSIFRLRRNRKKITDRICLSFYVTEEALDFSRFQIAQDDVYLAYWLATLVPVYDHAAIREKINQQNRWVTNFLPHAVKDEHSVNLFQIQNEKISRFCKNIFEKVFSGWMGHRLERIAKKFQHKHMSETPSGQKGDRSDVVVSDSVLKFHENDRREKFRLQWHERYHSLGV